MEPLLQKISAEDKICSIMGLFNIDLVKTNTLSDANQFFNTFSSNFFAPYILQPTRPISKIQLSDHLFQFAILEGFFKDLVPRKLNLEERNFKTFNEREFIETINTTDWDEILLLSRTIPIFQLTNFIHK